MATHYKTLGVPEDAKREDIRDTYRKEMRKHHPDVNRDDPNAEARAKDLNNAYEVLYDPVKRREYDKNLDKDNEFSSDPVKRRGYDTEQRRSADGIEARARWTTSGGRSSYGRSGYDRWKYADHMESQDPDAVLRTASTNNRWTAVLRTASTNNRWTAVFFAIFFGGFGLHKFYLGYTRAGIIHLLCIFPGLFLFFIPVVVMVCVGFIEGIIYLVMNDEKFHERYVLNQRPWF